MSHATGQDPDLVSLGVTDLVCAGPVSARKTCIQNHHNVGTSDGNTRHIRHSKIDRTYLTRIFLSVVQISSSYPSQMSCVFLTGFPTPRRCGADFRLCLPTRSHPTTQISYCTSYKSPVGSFVPRRLCDCCRYPLDGGI
jgi:hypothetical protein